MAYKTTFSPSQAKSLAVRVRDFRTENGLTQTELAKVMRVSRRTVERIECLHSRPYPGTFWKFISVERRFEDRKVIERSLKDARWSKEAVC
jgi:transcriptional regulator with XRE-family HTH domain